MTAELLADAFWCAGAIVVGLGILALLFGDAP